MSKTFRHSGDMGDVIFSLPTVRALGGGVLYLDPFGGLSRPLVKWPGRDCTKLNAEKIGAAREFLCKQPYIEEVRMWASEACDYDLDEFRRHHRYNNLADAHLAAFGLPFTERDTAWLTVDNPVVNPERPIVIHRNLKYHGNDPFWEANLPAIAPRSMFTGSSVERDAMMLAFGHWLFFFQTPDVTALARVIAGCQQFIGNQGLPHAIAEGMKKNLICEVDRLYPAAVFQRAGATYV